MGPSERLKIAGEAAEHAALLVLHWLRAIDAARGEMLHQREEIGQVSPGDPLLVEREDVGTGLGVNQVVRVLDALGDALERSHRADVVASDEGFELLVGDVGVDGHLERRHLSELAR